MYLLKRDVDSAAEAEATSKRHIAVHFFDDEKMPGSGILEGVGKDSAGVGGLFVEMDTLEESREDVLCVKNKEQHLCAEDLYTASWKFSRAMTSETLGSESESSVKGDGKGGEMWWEVRYDVKGPKKDYVSQTRYTRG